MGRWRLFLERFGLADRIWQLGSWVIWIIGGVSLVIGGAMTTWEWYWTTFQWAGFAMAFLAAWMILALGLVPIAHGVRLLRGDQSPIRKGIQKQIVDHESRYTHDPAEEAPDRESYYALLDLCLDYIMRSCERQIALQNAIIRLIVREGEFAEMAVHGWRYAPPDRLKEFWILYDILEEGIEGSDPTIRWLEMINCIKKLENNIYKTFCHESVNIIGDRIIEKNDREKLWVLWEEWRIAHNALIEKYEHVKRDIRFREHLWRKRDSRWGPIIEPEPKPVIGVIQKPQ